MHLCDEMFYTWSDNRRQFVITQPTMRSVVEEVLGVSLTQITLKDLGIPQCRTWTNKRSVHLDFIVFTF